MTQQTGAPPPSLRSPDALSRRATHHWRALFWLYAGALSMGTHWPRLQLGDPSQPPDKMLHFVAFAGLALFLWQARYLQRYDTLLVIGFAWALLDEITQQLPGLGRTFSLEDVLASTLGVASATLLLWSTRPRGGPVGRLRRARWDQVLDSLLARATPWAALASASALGATAGIPLAMAIDRWSGDPVPFQATLFGGVLGAGTVASVMLLFGHRREEARMLSEHRCLGCGERMELPASRCLSCHRRPLPAQWVPMPHVRWRDLLAACLPPILGGAAMLFFGFVVWLLLLILRRDIPAAGLPDRWISGLSKGMPQVIDATVLFAILAVTVDRARARLSRRIERAHEVCLECGQDLRGTAASDEVGRCGECGAGFVRLH